MMLQDFNPAAAAQAYHTANAALAHHGRSFYWARRLLGPVHATRATLLYGLCRRIDDLADTQGCERPHEALDALAHALSSGQSADPLTAEVIQLLRQCRIDTAIPLQLIRGACGDLEPVQIADEASLLRYCYCVAGTVGLMMSAALDTTTPAALPHAIDLGIAMQLTNICRDVREDAQTGRRYLPASLAGPLLPEELVQPDPAVQPVVRAAVLSLLDLADRYYASGEAGLGYLPARARAGILVAARVYRDIGVELRRRDGDYWSERVCVPNHRKLRLTMSALAQLPRLPRADQRPGRHDPALHAPLLDLPHTDTHSGHRHAC
jgi:phytoene synthase